MKRYIRARRLLACAPTITYKDYLIVCCAYEDTGDSWLGERYKVYSVGTDRNAPEFPTIEEAKEYIDELTECDDLGVSLG